MNETSRSVHDVYVGLFGTPLHTEHVDLDLLVAALTSAGRFRANLGFELNVDVAPGQRVFGSYLRGALSLFGRGEGDEAGATVTRFRTELGFLLGSYLTLRANHQLLLEVDIVVRPTPLADERKLEIGSVALGYNVRLTENVELINHVALDVPQAGERIAVQIMIGLIVTVPTRR